MEKVIRKMTIGENVNEWKETRSIAQNHCYSWLRTCEHLFPTENTWTFQNKQIKNLKVT